MYRLAWMGLVYCLVAASASAANVELEPLLKAIRDVGLNGQGNRQASAAWQKLAQADPTQLPQILAGMKDADLLAVNWLRSAVETIRDRQLQAGGKLPVVELEAFLADTQQHPLARRLAYELIAKVDSTAESRLIPKLVDDPSLELRRDAVAMLLDKAKALDPKLPSDVAVDAYRKILPSARDLDQIAEIEKQLGELNASADYATHYGFVTSWNVIGPFDNTNKSGFDIAYAPEREVKLTDELEGKGARVKWIAHVTDDPHGLVDLNELLGVHKGALGYAYTEFESAKDQDVDFRLGCMNATKIWLNGELIMSNEVYHTGIYIDQYLGKGHLKKGKNTILIKVAQNEQTEDWAKYWQFQLRICDEIGTAVLAVNRPSNRPQIRPRKKDKEP